MILTILMISNMNENIQINVFVSFDFACKFSEHSSHM